MTVKTDSSLRLARTIAADPETLFRAWTDAAELRQWSCPEGAAIEDVQVDLRVGGAYRIRMRGADGVVHTAVGVYREIDRPRRLVYTWDWQEAEYRVGETIVTVEFLDRGGSTEVVLVHDHFPGAEATRAHEIGWTSCLDRLERLFTGAASSGHRGRA